jgi:pSer/pThr/pTyr-binding forkhead associated (FHA) protein
MLRVGENRVGGGKDVEVRVAEGSVSVAGIVAIIVLSPHSEHHATIRKTDDTEITLNGLPIGAEPEPLLHGDRVMIGAVEFSYADEAQVGETIELGRDENQAIAVPSEAARNSRINGRLVSLVDGREYAVGEAGLSIGRDAGCDVVISAPEVSRRHAVIRSTADGYVLLDASANGVLVNEARVQTEISLGRGDTVRVGPEEFRFYAEPGSAAHSADRVHAPSLQLTGSMKAIDPSALIIDSGVERDPMAPAAGLARRAFALLEVVNEGPSKGRIHHITSPLVHVGRGEYNDICLNDESVSETHAKLQRRSEGWYLVDVNSTNGSYVAGVRLPPGGEAIVKHGTDVRFGGIKLLFRIAGAGQQQFGETRVIAGIKAPDPRRAEQRLREVAERNTPPQQAEAEPAKRVPVAAMVAAAAVFLLILYLVSRGR